MEYLGKLKGWGKEMKKIMITVALAAVASSVYQAWNNPYTTPLWFSHPYAFFNDRGSNPPAPAPSAIQLGLPFNTYPLAFNSSPPLNSPTQNVNSTVNTPYPLAFNSSPPLNSPTQNANSTVNENPIQIRLNSTVNSDIVNIGATANEESANAKSENEEYAHAKSEDSHPLISPPKYSTESFHRKKSEFAKRHQELLLAKKEIENADIVVDDPDLYWPLYHNISIFKKSYELMEKIFKVYVYREGQKPYVHVAELKGIYASEGWFMKLMGENKQFVVKDPKKAHMFYLPYSVYELVHWMYVPNSHKMRPLALFLKDYVNMLAAKYPFWNRTQGADHFFVACHDWGPYTTSEHLELRKNAIKVLCNADLSEGYFVLGKDVSLPETNLHKVKQPPRYLGGKSASQRSILAFFAGNMHGRVRPVLLQYWRDKDDDMKIYELLPSNVAKKMSYAQHMKSSKYCICPMGYEVNSPRIVEAIYYECIPVIIADNFVPPFNEVLDWNAFSITVAEKDIPKLKDILLNISLKKYLSMQLRVRKVQRHFLWHKRPVRYDIFHMILHSIWLNRLNQIEP